MVVHLVRFLHYQPMSRPPGASMPPPLKIDGGQLGVVKCPHLVWSSAYVCVLFVRASACWRRGERVEKLAIESDGGGVTIQWRGGIGC
jgi:hypothetical protein